MTERRVFIIGGDDPRKHLQTQRDLRAHYEGLDKRKRWRVVIEPYVRRRTDEQNGLLRVWEGMIADYTGHDQDEIHEEIKKRFIPEKIVTIGGNEEQVRSTKYLTTVEMGKVMDQVSAWAQVDFGLTLPKGRDVYGDEE